VATVDAAQTQQVVHSAQGQVETLGQGRGGRAALVAAKDGLPDNRRNGAWHGRQLQANNGDT
jgi:hypothetical protein